MKSSMTARIARGNLKKNYRFYIPRMAAETGLLACFYIVLTLTLDERIHAVRGGSLIPFFMGLGSAVIGVLSAILMLYTNRFLMKQRKREFGLYSVLGMEKKHICRVLLYESLYAGAVSVAAGLLFGVLFYKLCTLGICRLLKSEIVLGFYYLKPGTLIPAGLAFVLIDLVTYAVNCMSIVRMQNVDLLRSTHVGEREPKVRWILLVLGVISLGGGYWISLTVKSPLEALFLFFAAVFLVILGTYCLFVSGSIFILKALKRNPRIYYHKRRMTAISGLTYRMKLNGVGLASIALLATGVLVMTSTTVCLYSGVERTLRSNYPYDYWVSCSYEMQEGGTGTVDGDEVKQIIDEEAERAGLTVSDSRTLNYLEVAYLLDDGQMRTSKDGVSAYKIPSQLCSVIFITEDDYSRLGGRELQLEKDEIAIWSSTSDDLVSGDTLSFDGRVFRIADRSYNSMQIMSTRISVQSVRVVVADEEVLSEIDRDQKKAYGVYASDMTRRYCVRFEQKELTEKGPVFAENAMNALKDYVKRATETVPRFTMESESVWDGREALYAMYGTLLFLGILLGTVCLFATVLIIYYKQISEGYEDREHFQVMEKIGMSAKEIRSTVRTQILLVFFLPLLVAGIHLCFASPILGKLMQVLLMEDIRQLIIWMAISYLIFAAVYAGIYSLTAKVYYKIVH